MYKYKCYMYIYIKILFFFVIIYFYLLCIKYKNYNKSSIKNNDFKTQINNIYTKNNLGFKKILKINELFESEILYINETYLSNDYIITIKKFYDKYENFNIINNKDFKIKNRNYKKIDSKNFYYLCNSNKLIKPFYDKYNKYPLISVILPSYNKQHEILKSIRSIQNQSFKNIEIIIVDDSSKDESIKIYNQLLKTDKRIRIFFHLKNMGVWRSRLDGLLYSRGQYIINFDSGDLYADNFILEDSFNLIIKNNLDSVRFSFKLARDKKNIENNYQIFNFDKNLTKIILGHNIYNVENYIHGPIWNRLIKKKILLSSLNLIDSHILNAYKNLWEDRWWNQLTNAISNRNLMFNRVGYIYLKEKNGEGYYKLKNENEKDKTLHEIIYFWLFDYQMLPKKDNKKSIINNIRYLKNKSSKSKIKLSFLKTKFETFIYLLTLLIKDSYVDRSDKLFLKKILNKIKLYNINKELLTLR